MPVIARTCAPSSSGCVASSRPTPPTRESSSPSAARATDSDPSRRWARREADRQRTFTMRSRLQSDPAGMDEGRSRALRQPLASLIGLQVIDSASVILGVVLGRVVGDSTVDLLVRRRQLFRRSRYLRLQGDAI